MSRQESVTCKIRWLDNVNANVRPAVTSGGSMSGPGGTFQRETLFHGTVNALLLWPRSAPEISVTFLQIFRKPPLRSCIFGKPMKRRFQRYLVRTEILPTPGSACRASAIEYMCTKFGVDSSIRFPFRTQTHTQTHTQSQTPLITLSHTSPTPACDNDSHFNGSLRRMKTRSHPELVGDMSRVTLNFDLSKIPFVLF